MVPTIGVATITIVLVEVTMVVIGSIKRIVTEEVIMQAIGTSKGIVMV